MIDLPPFSPPSLHTATLSISNGGQTKQIAWPYLILSPSLSLCDEKKKEQGVVVVGEGVDSLMP